MAIVLLLSLAGLADRVTAQPFPPPLNDDTIRRLQEDLRARACPERLRFIDENIAGSDERAVVARLYAIFSLLGATDPSIQQSSCVYSDRRKALRAAIEQYQLHNELYPLERPYAFVSGEDTLAAALGANALERLAGAGVIGAMQDLVGLNLLCILRDQPAPGGFWSWALTHADGSSGAPMVERYLRRIAATPFYCRNLPGQASIERACFWNAAETALAETGAHPPTRSARLRVVVQLVRQTLRWHTTMEEELTEALEAAGSPGARDVRSLRLNERHFRIYIRKGCEAALPGAMAEIDQRARSTVTTTLDALIGSFE